MTNGNNFFTVNNKKCNGPTKTNDFRVSAFVKERTTSNTVNKPLAVMYKLEFLYDISNHYWPISINLITEYHIIQ